MILNFWEKLKNKRDNNSQPKQKVENLFEKYSPPEIKEITLKGNNVIDDIKECHEKFCEEYFIFLGDVNEVMRKRNNEIYSSLERLKKLGLDMSQNYKDLIDEKEKNDKIIRHNTYYELRSKFKKKIENYSYSSNFYYLSFNDFSKLLETYGYSYPTVFRNFTGRLNEETIKLLELIYNVGNDLANENEDYYYRSSDTDCLMKTRKHYSENDNFPIYDGVSNTIIEISNIQSSSEMKKVELELKPVIAINKLSRKDKTEDPAERINYTIPVFNKSINYIKVKLEDGWVIGKTNVVDSHRPLIVKKDGLPSILFHIWTEGVLVYGFI